MTFVIKTFSNRPGKLYVAYAEPGGRILAEAHTYLDAKTIVLALNPDKTCPILLDGKPI